MAVLSLAPDIGAVDRFSGPMVLDVPFDELTPAGGPEGRTDIKGVALMRFTLGGTVYDVPLSYRQKLKSKNGGRVFWESLSTSQSGYFKFYRNAPAVYLEEDV